MLLRVFSALMALLLVSCGSAKLSAPEISPYRMEIQQGNYVSQEMVAQLKLGMTKDQVRFVLGTPLITDSFHADRWDYVFRRQKPRSKELERHKLAVFFEDGKLARIDTDVIAATSADAEGIKTPAPPAAAPAAKPTPPPAKPEPPAVKVEPPEVKAQSPAVKTEPPSAKSEPSAVKPVAEKPSAASEAKPAPSASAAADKAAAPPAEKPPEKKGFWDKIKDAVKF